MRPIFGLSNENYAVRWQALIALKSPLSPAEREALYGYLRGHEPAKAEPMRGVLKNEIILLLKRQQPPPAALATVLLALFRDNEQDPVIRNYALQHLTTWYEESGQQREIQAALWAAVGEADGGHRRHWRFGPTTVFDGNDDGIRSKGCPRRPASAGSAGGENREVERTSIL